MAPTGQSAFHGIPDRSPLRPSRSWEMWVVALRGFPGEQDEIAAVFADRDDACAYARWWNREEVRRFGRESPVAATVEEIDFYPHDGWRPTGGACGRGQRAGKLMESAAPSPIRCR